MTTALQLRRGTTEQHSTFVGAIGEITVDTDKKTLVVNDGVTQGDTPLAREDSLTKFVRHDTAAQGLTGTQQGNARTNIGLGTLATQAANNVAITGGTLSDVTLSSLAAPLALTAGGTGATTAADARTALELGSAATLNVGTAANQVLQLDANGKIPAVDGSQLTGLNASYMGGRGEVFTSSGTFTVPAGVTAVKAIVVGGGGGGQAGAWHPTDKAGAGGGGGGGGGCAIKYLTGLTSGKTLTVTVGAAGGTSSIASGTQTISTVSATGGSKGGAGSTKLTTAIGGAGGAGGVGAGGDLNMVGGGGGAGGDSKSTTEGIPGGHGGSSYFGGGGAAPTNTTGNAGGKYGGGGSGGATNNSSGTGGGGAAGVVVFEW